MNTLKKIIFGSLVNASAWRIVKSVVFIAVFSYLGLALYLYFFQHQIIYFPTFQVDSTPADLHLDYRELWLPVVGEDKAIHAWSIPASADNDNRHWVLFCHGNAGNIGDRLTIIDILHQLGFSTLIFDYRGFGKSPGSPSEKNTYEDAAAAWQWLVTEKKVDQKRIVVFGRSLGGAVAAWLAQRKEPGMLVMESSFTSIVDIGRTIYPYFPVDWLARHRYPALEHVAGYRGPVLIMHSEDDEIVPMHMGRELYDAAPGNKLFYELRGGHNEVWYVMGGKYEELLQQGFEQLLFD